MVGLLVQPGLFYQFQFQLRLAPPLSLLGWSYLFLLILYSKRFFLNLEPNFWGNFSWSNCGTTPFLGLY